MSPPRVQRVGNSVIAKGDFVEIEGMLQRSRTRFVKTSMNDDSIRHDYTLKEKAPKYDLVSD